MKLTDQQYKESIKPLANTKSTQPEHGRPILCRGYDWTYFECTGILAKKGDGKTVFKVKRPNGTYENDSKTWKDVDTWEYVTP